MAKFEQARSLLARARRSAIVAAAILTTLAAAPAQATKIERVVSPGGIEAWVVRDSTVPLLAIQFAFTGGTSQDAADKLGTGNMVAALLDEGAGDLTSQTFQERLEKDAIELRFSADRDHLRGSLRTLIEKRDSAIDLLRLSLTSPRFDSEAVERIRNQIAVQIRRETTDPGSLAQKAWWAAAFPGHQYGREQKGTPETLAAVSIADLKAYAGKVIARDRLKVAIVGDIDLAAAGALLDRVFGALPAKADLTPVADVKPSGLGNRSVVTFNTPQAVMIMGGSGVPRKDTDFMSAYVVNHILGGGSFTSRLYEEVREKRGLAYGINTYMYPMLHAALFMGYTQVRADRAGESLGIIEQEIRRMAEAGPTDEELGKAKEYLKGSYGLNFDTSTKIAQQLVQIQIEDLGIDYINTRNAMIDAVSLADAKRVAKSFLEGGMLTTVVGRPIGVTSSGGG